MKFRLTYEGELRPTQGRARDHQTNPLAFHKHEIRRAFHRQLKQLWDTNPFLRNYTVDPHSYMNQKPVGDVFTDLIIDTSDSRIPLSERVADQYHEFGYRFVPLVRQDIFLTCSLEILFLRRDIPGHVISAGDLDNRIKTLIDALRRPRSKNELVEQHQNPGKGEDPFYCLLEDDDQVSALTVETDTLLDPPNDDENDLRKVKIVVAVELKPYLVTMFNLSFV